jgi:hypothetical protein
MTRETSIDEQLVAVSAAPAAASRTREWAGPLALGACLLVLSCKFLLIGRLNVNWDEFLFLTHVHSLVRGELTSVFQTAYTHLFTWLLPLGDEMAQIIAARWLMMGLLAATVVLVARLASRWTSSAASWVGALCYVTMSPVLFHGGSFRYDSMIAPLGLAVLVLLTGRAQTRRTLILAGVCFGVSVAISVKAIMLAPTLLVLELARAPGGAGKWRSVLERLASVGAVGILTAAVILAAHAWSLPPAAHADIQGFTTSVARKTLFDVPLMPRWDYFRIYLRVDKAGWILLGVGLIFAFRQRKWAALGCALSLAPLLFYRNSFPYYYVVMLAPACVLAAVAADGLRGLVRQGGLRSATWVPAAVCLLLVAQGAIRLGWLSRDAQTQQRQTIAAVHQIFPTPVPYIDHSGMIASFRKVNFFMSSWGVESYRAAGKSFMAEALARYRPPLLIVNRGELDPDGYQFRWLLPQDQLLIQQDYVPYWGAIRVAGTQVQVSPSAPVEAHVPFPGRYRLESDAPVRVDGVARSSGDILELESESFQVSTDATASRRAMVRVVWADARPAPKSEPPLDPMYTGL